MSILVKVACPGCGATHDLLALGAEVRCRACGRDFRAQADGENSSQILSVTPDELDNVPYSQRTVQVPVNKVSSLILADPALLADKFLRDMPLRENARWVGKVRLLKKIGQGGMGAVYHGYDESLALDVAVKILPMPLGERDGQFVDRFRQEARISAQINHPNVVRTLHVDEEGELIYLVMDYVEGQTASKLAEQKGPLPLPQALQIVHDVTAGCRAAHNHGVIHRDIKPDNILVGSDGRVLLTDLGLAKAIGSGGTGSRMPVTRVGLLLGTPEYMSPEQWEIGGAVGAASDIWSIGATLWMLLTQRPPWFDKDMGILSRNIKDGPLPDIRALRAEVPDVVVEILERCLAKRQDERFASCAELMDALKVAQQDGALAGQLPRASRAMAAPAVSVPMPRPSATPSLAIPGAALRAVQARSLASQPPPPPRKFPVKIFVAASLLAVGAGTLIYKYHWDAQIAASEAALRDVSLDVRYPARVEPGESAQLTANLRTADPSRYAIQWITDKAVYSGSALKVPLETDTDFSVMVMDKASSREVARQNVRIAVELKVRAAEKDSYRIEAGTALKLEGAIRGGPGESNIEARWIDTADPSKALIAGPVLEIGKDWAPGRHTLALQARTKDKSGWASATSDKVSVEITPHIPAEFIAAMKKGSEALERANKAASGPAALEEARKALAQFEAANTLFADPQAANQIDSCQQRVGMEERYAALIEEGRSLRETASKLDGNDGVRRLAAWSEASRPYAAALALFDRVEARTEAALIAGRIAELKGTLEKSEQERAEYEGIRSRARHSAKEARKYLSPAVALPHWENALAEFAELGKRYPRRTDEFALELKEAQENRDKAYLFVNFGVIPERQADETTTKPVILLEPGQPGTRK